MEERSRRGGCDLVPASCRRRHLHTGWEERLRSTGFPTGPRLRAKGRRLRRLSASIAPVPWRFSLRRDAEPRLRESMSRAQDRLASVVGLEDRRVAGLLEHLANEPVDARE